SVAAELKQSQDRLQELLQEPEARRRELQQQRQVAESKGRLEQVQSIDEQLQSGVKAFDQAVGLVKTSLAKLEQDLATAKKELDKLKAKPKPSKDEETEIAKLEARIKSIDGELTVETRNAQDRRVRLTGLAAELRQLSLPTPLSTEVVSWDGTV